MDEGGLELPHVETPFVEAAAGAWAMWPELLEARRDPLACRFDIATESGETLMRLDFAELIREGQADRCAPTHANEVIVTALNDTHAHASNARLELRASFEQVRDSLKESKSLLARLSAYETKRLAVGANDEQDTALARDTGTQG